MPSCACCSSSSGALASFSYSVKPNHGVSLACKKRAHISTLPPFFPISSKAFLLFATCSKRCFSSLITKLLPKLDKFISVLGKCSACFSAALTVLSNFCNAIGFSKKSNAPIRVASTAVSIVPWPDIITTGMVNSPALPHSFSRLMPSQSGIQISSSTTSGRCFRRASRAACAFSASVTW